jgi:hypothetical protein
MVTPSPNLSYKGRGKGKRNRQTQVVHDKTARIDSGSTHLINSDKSNVPLIEVCSGFKLLQNKGDILAEIPGGVHPFLVLRDLTYFPTESDIPVA